MLSTVLGALLPVVVTILLGFVAAWHHDFDAKQASTLNRMVLLYAVPMGLFAGTASTRREVLSQDISLVIALCAAIIGLYVVAFLISRFAFRAPIGFSAMAALAVAFVQTLREMQEPGPREDPLLILQGKVQRSHTQLRETPGAERAVAISRLVIDALRNPAVIDQTID